MNDLGTILLVGAILFALVTGYITARRAGWL
jgi:hypothetical protein